MGSYVGGEKKRKKNKNPWGRGQRDSDRGRPYKGMTKVFFKAEEQRKPADEIRLYDGRIHYSQNSPEVEG